MTHLTVRRLQVDLKQGVDRHWNGDALMTAFFNALSMSFPVGEQFFIDSVKLGVNALPHATDHAVVKENARKFVGQEATHRHLHDIFNHYLLKQGMQNHWEKRILKRMDYLRRRLKKSKQPYLHELAITAAYEHLTAVLGAKLLERMDQKEDWLLRAMPQMKLLWRWHASEEIEHRSIAFDLYKTLGGNHQYRVRWFYTILFHTCFDVIHQTFSNLWNDGSLSKPSTWWSAFKFFLGRHGFFHEVTCECFSYLRKDFNPSTHGNTGLAQEWLKNNEQHWTTVI
jgi:predicted metal-dependent hydrolase